MHALSNRGRFDAEHLGNLGGRQIFQIAQHERRATTIRQSVDGVSRFGGEALTIEEFLDVIGHTEFLRCRAMDACLVERRQKGVE